MTISPRRAGAAAGRCPTASAGATPRTVELANPAPLPGGGTGEGGALLSDQEALTVCDAAGQLALLRLGLGWGACRAIRCRVCWTAASWSA